MKMQNKNAEITCIGEMKMLYLVPIPIVFVAVIIKIVAQRNKMKIFNTICNIVIILGIIIFVYFFADSMGFNIVEKIQNL